MLGGAWARQGPLAPRCHGQWPLLPAYLVGPSRLGLRRCASGSPLGSGLPYPAQKTAPEDRAPAAAGGFVGKDLTPALGEGQREANRGFVPPKTAARRAHADPLATQVSAPLTMWQQCHSKAQGPGPAQFCFNIKCYSKRSLPYQGTRVPEGGPVSGRWGAGLDSRRALLPPDPIGFRAGAEKKEKKKKKKDGVGAGLLLQADSRGKLQLLRRAPWGSSHAPEKLIFTLYS